MHYVPPVPREGEGGQRPFSHVDVAHVSLEICRVSLSDVDRLLLDRCLQNAPRAWEDFVDRFIGLVTHVVRHTAASRSVELDMATRDDLVAEVFLKLLENDSATLRRFRRRCSLATYLAVVSRRIVARRLHATADRPQPTGSLDDAPAVASSNGHFETRIDNREHLEQLLSRLEPQEAHIVRMYHLEGKSYRDISRTIGVSENSIGPTLSRARQRLRNSS